MKLNKILIVGVLAVSSLAFTTSSLDQEKPGPWNAPAAAKSKANPLKGDAASVATGKTLYNQHCKSCHGAKGKGDGSKAAQLDTDCGDFTSAAVQSQTDGELFYKTSEGRKDMPSFKKKIPDAEDIWAVVNYMRTLK